GCMSGRRYRMPEERIARRYTDRAASSSSRRFLLELRPLSASHAGNGEKRDGDQPKRDGMPEDDTERLAGKNDGRLPEGLLDAGGEDKTQDKRDDRKAKLVHDVAEYATDHHDHDVEHRASLAVRTGNAQDQNRWNDHRHRNPDHLGKQRQAEIAKNKVYPVREEYQEEHAIHDLSVIPEDRGARYDAVDKEGSEEDRGRKAGRYAQCDERNHAYARHGTVARFRGCEPFEFALAELLRRI